MQCQNQSAQNEQVFAAVCRSKTRFDSFIAYYNIYYDTVMLRVLENKQKQSYSDMYIVNIIIIDHNINENL